MTLDLQPAAPPLRTDDAGVVRVGLTRVALESVLHAHLEGESAEGIVERFPALGLAEAHETIAWYLRHREDAEACLARRRREGAENRASAEARAPSATLRTRLLARRPR